MTIVTDENIALLNKPKQKQKVQQIKNMFKEDFPNCFKSGEEKLPLKIGIHLQVHFHYRDDTRFEPQLIQQGLNSYAMTPKYLSKIIEGAPRVDINGNPAGQVTAEEALYAKSKLSAMNDALEKKIELKLQKLAAQKLAAEQLEVQKLSGQQKASLKPVAEVSQAGNSEKRPLLTLSEIANNNDKSSPQTQAKTKEEIKKAKQEKYAKKMASRKGAK